MSVFQRRGAGVNDVDRFLIVQLRAIGDVLLATGLARVIKEAVPDVEDRLLPPSEVEQEGDPLGIGSMPAKPTGRAPRDDDVIVEAALVDLTHQHLDGGVGLHVEVERDLATGEVEQLAEPHR